MSEALVVALAKVILVFILVFFGVHEECISDESYCQEVSSS